MVFLIEVSDIRQPETRALFQAGHELMDKLIVDRTPSRLPIKTLSGADACLLVARSEGVAVQVSLTKRGDRQKVMRLATSEFIRRFLIHVLPDRFHRIRHYGLLASAQRKVNIARARVLIRATKPEQEPPPEDDPAPLTLREPCPCCGGSMRVIEIFRRGQKPMSRAPPREQAA